jgi:phosphatidylglycerophosphatase A
MPRRALNPSVLIASVFGAGFAPFAPGTFGTLAAALIYLLLPSAWFAPACPWPVPIALGGLFLFGVAVSTMAEKKLSPDDPRIVIDEFVGFYIAVLLLPKTLMVALYGFVLFRVFDIAKPFPINRSQRLPGGWGVMVDDLIAGIYANLIIRIMLKLAPRFFGL